jgi:hypothetical protein
MNHTGLLVHNGCHAGETAAVEKDKTYCYRTISVGRRPDGSKDFSRG